MSCDAYFEKMSAWVDDALPAVEDLKDHLAHCIECQARYEKLGLLRSVMREAMDVAPDEAFATRTAEKIQMQLARQARTPRWSLSDTARWLWGGLAWSLVGAGSGVVAVSSVLAGDSIHLGEGADPAALAYRLPGTPDALFKAASSHLWAGLVMVFMLSIGLWLLRPLSAWRRLRENPRPAEAIGFGLRVWLMGIWPVLPAVLPELLIDPYQHGLALAWGWVSVWTTGCLALVCGQFMWLVSRNVNHMFLAFAACLVLASGLEPALSPPFISPGVRTQFMGASRQPLLEQATIDRCMKSDQPFTEADLLDNSLTYLADPVPNWLCIRWALLCDVVPAGRLWWTALAVLGLGGLGAALLIVGRGIGLAGLALAAGCAAILPLRGMFTAPEAWAALQAPHTTETRTAVALTYRQSNGQLLGRADNRPGLVQQLLDRPPADVWAVRQHLALERGEATVEWDPAEALEALDHCDTVIDAQDILRVITVGGQRGLAYYWTRTRPSDPGQFYCPMFRSAALRWSERTGIWQAAMPASRLPQPTGHVRGRLFVAGEPAPGLPVRLIRSYSASSPGLADDASAALRITFEDATWADLPIAVRTDAEGRFDFSGPPPGDFTPAVLLPGNVTVRTSYRHAPTLEVRGGQDVNLGDIHLDVTP
ncbi:MAG TPA: hypothetical protein VGO93_23135 [Candidatus Xenobia bacterium]|jgi:hypothetical protein